MHRRTAFHAFLASIVLLGSIGTSVQAQWSILAPGKREAPVGQNRYAMLVFANPVPGLENDFNDWYTTTHMGDLVQLPGWMGAQRFRIVSSLNPRPTREGYRHGYLIIWDQEGTDPSVPQRLMTEAFEPIGTPPEQLGDYMKSEIARWAKLVKATGTRID